MTDPNPEFWQNALRERAELLALLLDSTLGEGIALLADLILRAIDADAKVLLFGNGGSAATAQHLAAELVGRFEGDRRALPAMALTTDTSILTAVANDYGFDRVFERQIDALARPGDVAIAFSTSGKSPNVLKGLRAAARRGAATVALVGRGTGAAKRLADLPLVVPSTRVPLVQEAHELVVHVLCEEIDARLRAAGPRRARRSSARKPRS